MQMFASFPLAVSSKPVIYPVLEAKVVNFKHEKFQLARIIKGYTQKGVAQVLGVDNSTVSRWETGGIDPTPKHIARICKLLDLKPEDLYLDDDDDGKDEQVRVQYPQEAASR